MNKIIEPTLAELKNRGIRYKGFLYAGLMIENNEIKVLEYNCRFGDPETQPILMRMKSDFFEALFESIKNRIVENEIIEWDDRYALGVVMASKGYPEKYDIGFPISGISEESESIKVFHCGTKKIAGEILTDGGRVLCVTGLGENLENAFQSAYASTSKFLGKELFIERILEKGINES